MISKLLSKLFYDCLLLKKFINRKHFSIEEKFDLVSRKIFYFYYLSENYKKFINITLFIDYIKFNPQNFNYYIYFVLNIFFSISSLRI